MLPQLSTPPIIPSSNDVVKMEQTLYLHFMASEEDDEWLEAALSEEINWVERKGAALRATASSPQDVQYGLKDRLAS